jgi:HEAT repeat protein
MCEPIRGRPRPGSRCVWMILFCVAAWSCGVSRQDVELAENDALNALRGLVHNGELDGALVAEAVTALGELDGADMGAAVTGLLNHPDEIVVLRAVEAMGKHDVLEAVGALQGLFERTGSAFVKVEVAAALERLNPGTMIPWLSETLRNGEFSMVRFNAAAALGQLGSRDTTPALRQAFRDDQDPVVRSAAVLALAGLSDVQSLPEIADTLISTKQLSTALVMVEALETFGTAEARTHLEVVAKQSTWQQSLRIRCFEALGGLSASSIGAYLKERLLEEGNALDRELAAEGLGWIQDSTAVDLLRSAFYSPESQPFRLSAAWSLATLGHGAGISEELEDDLQSVHSPFRRRAAEILGIIGDARRIPALKNAFSNSKEYSVRRAIVQALGNINDGESVVVLMWAFQQDVSLETRETIVEALGQMTLREAHRALKEILEQSEEAILQAAALRGLAQSRDLKQLETLRSYLNNAEPGVRLEAARGIFELARAGNRPG